MIKAVARRISAVLAKHPRIIFWVQQFWLKVGHEILDIRTANWVIRRPEWIRGRAIESRTSKFSSSLIDPTEYGTIANRIIRMVRSKPAESGLALIPGNTIWGQLRDLHYRDLLELIKSEDSDALQVHLAQLFRTKAVNGYTYGSTFNSWPHRWAYLPIQIELSAVTLAESLGLIRAECHEQGEIAFWRSLCSPDELMARLEQYFGFRIEQPRFGDPNGIYFGGRFLTRETCSHIYTAHRIVQAIERKGLSLPIRVVEIGGGFGGTCYWTTKLLGSRLEEYVVIDLPEVELVQALFLGKAFPDRLVLPGESSVGISSPIRLVPYNEIETVLFRPNVVLNQDSMPEMPVAEVRRYLEWISRNLDGVFLSFNQETYSKGGADLQVCVPEVVAVFPNLRRISRETSWDRRGYVEETYETVK